MRNHPEPTAQPPRSPEAPTRSASLARGEGMDQRYRGFFRCFNQQQYYEAHDVLEGLWLACRGQFLGDFYKGLIQLAGAFVHLQKQRPQPARSLLRSAARYLGPYAPWCEGLDVGAVVRLAGFWTQALERQGPEALQVLRLQPPLLPSPDGAVKPGRLR